MLPYVQTTSKELNFIQTKWKSELDPVLSSRFIDGNELKNISIVVGSNTINHKLSRKPQGWVLTDTNAAVSLYRSRDFNDKTLTLISDATATISLWVF